MPINRSLRHTVLATAVAIYLTCSCSDLGYAAPASTVASTSLLVGYFPCYKGGSFSDYANKLDFRKMTHLNLAFGNPPKCDGVCSSSSNMDFSIHGQTDADITALVAAAHAAGVKVLISIGGGGGDQMILQFYNAGLSNALVASLDTYVKAHNLDGVDIDIEDPSNMGAPFAVFVKSLIDKFHPQGRLVTAAVAKYLQDSMPDSALHQFDFINVMNYSSYNAAVTALQFYSSAEDGSQKQDCPRSPVLRSKSGRLKGRRLRGLFLRPIRMPGESIWSAEAHSMTGRYSTI
jgi:chitinase